MRLVGKIETIYPIKDNISTLVVSKKYKNQARQEIAFTLFGDWDERLQNSTWETKLRSRFKSKQILSGTRTTDLICRKIRLVHKTSKGQVQ